MVSRERNEPGAAVTGVDNCYGEMEARKINRGSQPCRSAADDEAVQQGWRAFCGDYCATSAMSSAFRAASLTPSSLRSRSLSRASGNISSSSS